MHNTCSNTVIGSPLTVFQALADAVDAEERIWIDGCFDFFHHGHAGVMLQARQLGKELYVGVHSDEEIVKHKGDPVMSLDERLAAAEACRWVTAVVSDAPYVTDLDFVDHYACQYVVHGDDITSDNTGEDCYRFVKEAGRMKIVKRTPDISTTDLVGRMLLCTKQHHMRSLHDELLSRDRSANPQTTARVHEMVQRIRAYASDESGCLPGVQISFCSQDQTDGQMARPPSEQHAPKFIPFDQASTDFRIVKKPDQHFVYVDGSFDLFSSGHIEFLRRVKEVEREEAHQDGWDSDVSRQLRLDLHGKDYDRAFVVAGIHDDVTVNRFKGSNYPIMNVYERGLCVLQCKYVDAVVFGAPYDVNQAFLDALPLSEKLARVYHGKTNFFGTEYDGYSYPRRLHILRELPEHAFQSVNAAQIYRRIMENKTKFEERQKKKGIKAIGEAEAKKRETEAVRASQKG